MNRKQVILLVVLMGAIAAMGLVPPFVSTWKNDPGTSKGYHIITDPPSHTTVDVGLLIAQWAGALILGGIGYAILKDR